MSVHDVLFLCITQSTRFPFYMPVHEKLFYVYSSPQGFILCTWEFTRFHFYVYSTQRDFIFMHMAVHDISFLCTRQSRGWVFLCCTPRGIIFMYITDHNFFLYIVHIYVYEGPQDFIFCTWESTRFHLYAYEWLRDFIFFVHMESTRFHFYVYDSLFVVLVV